MDSYLIHFDPVDDTLSQRYGSITFDRPILGFLLESDALDDTDMDLGATGVSYPTPGSTGARGFEIDSNDHITLGEDGRSIHFEMGAQNSSDQIRVLVEP